MCDREEIAQRKEMAQHNHETLDKLAAQEANKLKLEDERKKCTERIHEIDKELEEKQTDAIQVPSRDGCMDCALNWVTVCDCGEYLCNRCEKTHQCPSPALKRSPDASFVIK